MGDKGYVGNDMITPIKKPAHRGLLDWEKIPAASSSCVSPPGPRPDVTAP
jgi:hypothetical protein